MRETWKRYCREEEKSKMNGKETEKKRTREMRMVV